VQYHSVTVTVGPKYSSQHFVLKHTQVFDRKVVGKYLELWKMRLVENVEHYITRKSVAYTSPNTARLVKFMGLLCALRMPVKRKGGMHSRFWREKSIWKAEKDIIRQY
jgi:hypothetical protein